MSSDIAIKVENLSKCFQIYEQPRDRLKQFIMPRLQRLVGQTPKKYFREFWALKNVSFEIKKGETVGIIGRNGSGKSTLLQMICGTLAPTVGTIQTNGRLAALLELGSGFNPEFTGRENVYMNASVLGLSKLEIDARFNDIADFADIGDFIEQPVKTYSSGMYVRLAFAIQANVDPEILIVDEALAVGDAYFVHRCMNRFQEMQSKGTTILLVTHDATAVRQLCDRAIWIDNGMSLKMGEVSEVVDRYLAYLFSEVGDINDRQSYISEETSQVVSNIDSKKDERTSMHEKIIPNVDQRYGNGLCEVVGIGIYDKLGFAITETPNDSNIVLRISIKNNHPKDNLKIGVGYTFRNSNGVDISSSDTIVTNTDIGFCAPGKIITVSAFVEIPILHPDFYSIIPSACYFDGNSKPIETDRVINAFILKINSKTKVNVGMRFQTTFQVDVLP